MTVSIINLQLFINTKSFSNIGTTVSFRRYLHRGVGYHAVRRLFEIRYGFLGEYAGQKRNFNFSPCYIFIEVSIPKLKINPLAKKFQNYRNKWVQHVRQIDTDRLPYLVMKYQPCGKGSQGRHFKRLLDC